jgi:hypothetical protein
MPCVDFFSSNNQLHVGHVFNEIPNKTENVMRIEMFRHNFKLKFKNIFIRFHFFPHNNLQASIEQEAFESHSCIA